MTRRTFTFARTLSCLLVCAGSLAACEQRPVLSSKGDGEQGEFTDDPLVDEWPADLPQEKLNKVRCGGDLCFVIEKDAKYCAIEPREYRGGDPFATKAKLHFRGGVFPLVEGKDPAGLFVKGLEVELESILGSAKIVDADQRMPYGIEIDELAGSERQDEWFTIDGRVGDKSGENRFSSLLISTTSVHELWQQKHFRLGDPKSSWWWCNTWRDMVLSPIGRPKLLPDAPGSFVRFAPCEDSEGQAHWVEVELKDGKKVRFEFRVLYTSTMSGYTLYRLKRARGSIRGRSFDVTDYFDLAAFWGGPATRPTVPMMAVRFEHKGGSDELCGLVFTPESVYTRGKARWRLQELRCDKQIGSSIPYVSVNAPES